MEPKRAQSWNVFVPYLSAIFGHNRDFIQDRDGDTIEEKSEDETERDGGG